MYVKKTWKDEPSKDTPLDANGLNNWEKRIGDAVDPLHTTREADFLAPANGISNNGSVKVVKDNILNLAYLFGRIDIAGNSGNGRVLTTLPEKYRPKYTQYFLCDGAAGLSSVRVMVESGTGNILNTVALNSPGIISLSGIVIDIS